MVRKASGIGSRGTGGLRSGSVKALSVARFPSATLPLSNACLPAEISPNWTNLSAFAALFSMVSRRVRRLLRVAAREASSHLHTSPHWGVPLTC